MNRSPDPVTGVVVGVLLGRAPEVDIPGDDDFEDAAVYLLPLSSLGPCSVLSITPANLRYRLDGDRTNRTFEFQDSVKWKADAIAVTFTDANGMEWLRTPRLLVGTGSDSGRRWLSLMDRGPTKILVFKQEPTSIVAEQCQGEVAGGS
jgi:hypothetical protein